MSDRPMANTETAQIIEDSLKQWHRSNALAALRAPWDIGSIFDGFLIDECLGRHR